VHWTATRLPALESLAAQPFHRYLNRSFLLIAVAGLPLFFRSIGMRSWRDLGLGKLSGRWRALALGFVGGFISLACVAGAAVVFGARTLNLDHSPASLLEHTLKAVLAASVVAPIEEIIFRGALFGSLRKVYPWILALLLSSLVFAAVHFF